MTCQTREYEEIPFATFVNILHFTYIKYYSGQWGFFVFVFVFYLVLSPFSTFLHYWQGS